MRSASILSLAIGSLVGARPAAADVHDRVDPAVRFQTIDNFGASDAWTMQRVGTWSDASKQRVADLLFSVDKGIGLSCWRFNLGAGVQRKSIRNPMRTVETFELSQGMYDWHRQAPEQWFLTAAKARGVDQFLAFANSPPGRMTRNGLTNHDDDETVPTNLKPGFEDQYAAYLVDILAHFRDDGVLGDPGAKIDFRYVSPVNETQSPWTDGQEGSRVDNDTIRRIVLALKRRLEDRQLHARVLTPECSNYADMLRPARGFTNRYHAPYGDYVNFFTAQPDLADVLGHTLCHHLYGSPSGADLKRATDRLGDRMRQHPDWKIWMSEICIMEPTRDTRHHAGPHAGRDHPRLHGPRGRLRLAVVARHERRRLQGRPALHRLAPPRRPRDGHRLQDALGHGQLQPVRPPRVRPRRPDWRLGDGAGGAGSRRRRPSAPGGSHPPSWLPRPLGPPRTKPSRRRGCSARRTRTPSPASWSSSTSTTGPPST